MDALTRMENEEGVTILYAAESGSRAWGFASADSDYDVRFIYKRPVRDYVRLSVSRDVIERPIVDDLDVNGWDIVKALRLFRKSNPSLMEWLFSPIVYVERENFADQLRQWTKEHYSLHRLAHHYLNMAKGNYRTHLEGRAEIQLKKYLYVLRPLLCIQWVEQRESVPPTSMWKVMEGVDLQPKVSSSIVELINRKQQTGEMGQSPPQPVLEQFIQQEIERISGVVADIPDRNPSDLAIDNMIWRELGV
nr:nucleotidyltransferase domain-containing protein [Desmospora activa]